MFTLKCYSEEGVEDIKRALRAGEATGKPENRLKINLISSPLFVINAVSFDPNEGLAVVKSALEKVRESITEISVDSEFEVKEEPKIQGFRDEREYENMLSEMERENNAGDSEDEFIEGMGTRDLDSKSF